MSYVITFCLSGSRGLSSFVLLSLLFMFHI